MASFSSLPPSPASLGSLGTSFLSSFLVKKLFSFPTESGLDAVPDLVACWIFIIVWLAPVGLAKARWPLNSNPPVILLLYGWIPGQAAAKEGGICESGIGSGCNRINLCPIRSLGIDLKSSSEGTLKVSPLKRIWVIWGSGGSVGKLLEQKLTSKGPPRLFILIRKTGRFP